MRSIQQEVRFLEKLQTYVLKHRPIPQDKRPYVDVHFMDETPIAFRAERYEMSRELRADRVSISVRTSTLYATADNREGIPAWEYSYNGVLLGIVPK